VRVSGVSGRRQLTSRLGAGFGIVCGTIAARLACADNTCERAAEFGDFSEEFYIWVKMATPSAPSPAAEERRGRVPTAIRRIRPPKTLVLTVVGALFTLWVLPAFTRQWEDRQKAREIQSALVEEIAIASSEAHAAASAGTLGTNADAAWDKWQVEQNKVEARLRAYFGANVVDEWTLYADAQGAVLAIAGIDSDYASPWVVKPLPTSASIVIQAHVDTLLKAPGTERWSRPSIDNDYFASADPSLRASAVGYAQDDLANSRSIVIASILAASPHGYSTSRRDLLSDLLP
jgi:hypothetical protein